MRHKSLFWVGVVSVLFLMVQPAAAVNYHGKIKLVQVTSAGTRFLTETGPVSLFATGDFKEVLIQAFFKKAALDIGYTVIPCTGGITGTCGNVNFVSVNTTGLP
jgi:hypothetical protein